MTPAAARRPAHRRQGFTIVEMAVTLVVAGLLLAFALPRLTGSENFAQDSRAQTTASGALDTAVQLWLRDGPRSGPPCPLGSGSSTAMSSPQPDNQPSNDPAFGNPCVLSGANGDVAFVPSTTVSAGVGSASVAAEHTSAGWEVAVAVLAASRHGTVSGCWIAIRYFGAPPAGSPAEAYSTHTAVNAGDVAGCTGAAALAYDLDAWCLNPGAGIAPYGLRWTRPCPDFTP